MLHLQTHCDACGCARAASANGVNHGLHLLGTLVTGGMWLFAWVLIAATHTPVWRCTTCGTQVFPYRKAATPASVDAAPVSVAANAAPPAANTGSTEGRLRRLQDLRDAGMITGAEYDQKRSEILREL